MSVQKERDPAEFEELCKTVKKLVPTDIGEDAWYLVVAAVLIASPSPQLIAVFYKYLAQHESAFKSPEALKRLSLRLRDVHVKLLTVVGGPRVLSALMPFAQAEGNTEVKAQSSKLSPKWENLNVAATYERGLQTLDTIYGASFLPQIFATWGDHTEDVKFMEVFTVYGLYMSDFEVMTALETEAVVYASISCTGLKGPGIWHMRGMGRLLGARGNDDDSENMRRIKDQLRDLKQAVMSVVEWVGEEYVRRADLQNWVNVGDVVRDLGGWGAD